MALVGAALGYAYFNFDGASRAFRLFATLDAAADGETLSRSDQVRILLYDSAWEQFLASPLFGQGFGQLMDAAAPRLAAIKYPLLENLHSDLADFAVVAGSFGLLAFGLIILAPLTVVMNGSGWSNRPVLFGAIMLSAGYVVLGLTNAMFGVLAQTVLYGMLVGMLAALSRAGNQAVRASSTA
jgi:O-antigen ligase